MVLICGDERGWRGGGEEGEREEKGEGEGEGKDR